MDEDDRKTYKELMKGVLSGSTPSNPQLQLQHFTAARLHAVTGLAQLPLVWWQVVPTAYGLDLPHRVCSAAARGAEQVAASAWRRAKGLVQSLSQAKQGARPVAFQHGLTHLQQRPAQAHVFCHCRAVGVVQHCCQRCRCVGVHGEAQGQKQKWLQKTYKVTSNALEQWVSFAVTRVR